MDIKIKKATQEETAELYENFILPYFPECEVKSLKSILRMMQTGLYSIIYAEVDGKPQGVAFMTTYPGGSLYLLDYLAVAEGERSKGLGGLLLKASSNFAGDVPVLIETEAVAASKNDEERLLRERRNSFYKRNGAVCTGVNTCIFGMTYDNWTLFDGERPSNAQVQDAIEQIYRFMVNNEEKYRENVFIPYTIN